MVAITKRSGFPLAQLVLLLGCTMQHDPNPVRRGRRHSGFSSVMSTPAFCNNRSNRAMSWVVGGCTPLLCSQAFRVFSRHCWAALPQLSSSTSGSRSLRAIFRSRRAILSRRVASGFAIEQHAVAIGLMHNRTEILRTTVCFTR